MDRHQRWYRPWQRLRGAAARCAASGAAVVLAAALPAQARNGATPSEVFAVFTKGSSELIVNLGDHDEFAQLQLNLGSLPAPFSTLSGASVAIVGDFDEAHTVAVGGLQIPRPNVMFGTAAATPELASDPQVSAYFDKLTAGSSGFIDTVRSVPIGGSVVRSTSDASSFATKLGPGAAQSGLPFAITQLVPAQASGLLLPVFGAANSVLPQAGGPPHETAMVLPLRITAAGLIKRIVLPSEAKPVPSRLYAVFTRPGKEVVVSLGDHDDLTERPVQLDAAALAELGGSTVGASFAVVGVFDKNHAVLSQGSQQRRANLMYSSPAGTVDLADPNVGAAFNLLVTTANTGFIDLIPASLAVGSHVVPAAGSSFAAKFGSHALGSFPFSVDAPVGPAGSSVQITGAAIAVQPTLPTGRPHEVRHILQLTVTPGGQVSAFSVI